MRQILLSLLIGVAAMSAAPAQDAARTPASGSAERTLLLDTARAPAEQKLHQQIQLDVQQLKVSGDWAFLHARLQNAGGKPVDYAGTEFAEAAEQGFKSKTYAALLRRNGEHWDVTTYVIGPTDPAWLGWSDQFGAPSVLFEGE